MSIIQYIYIFTYICLQINRIFIFYINNIECKIINIQNVMMIKLIIGVLN